MRTGGNKSKVVFYLRRATKHGWCSLVYTARTAAGIVELIPPELLAAVILVCLAIVERLAVLGRLDKWLS